VARILVVEDDEGIREMLRYNLVGAGYAVQEARDGATGLRLAQTGRPDLVLLDLMLPGMSGLEVCRALRRSGRTPIIMLTAKDAEVDKIVGLELGADDYITKPFSVEELAARIRARLRGLAEEGSTLRAGPLAVDLAAHRAQLYDKEVLLSARELTLLASLLRHQGEVLSRRKLLQLVWKVDFDPGSNVVEVYVAALRRKIGADFIETVRGLGYRFVVPDDTLAEDQTAAR